MKNTSKLNDYALHKMLVDAIAEDGIECDFVSKTYDPVKSEKGGVGFRKIFTDINNKIIVYHKFLKILTGEWRADIRESIPVIDFLHTENTSITKYYSDTSNPNPVFRYQSISDIEVYPNKDSLWYIEAEDPFILNRAISGSVVSEQFFNCTNPNFASTQNLIVCPPQSAVKTFVYRGVKGERYIDNNNYDLENFSIEESTLPTTIFYYCHSFSSNLEFQVKLNAADSLNDYEDFIEIDESSEFENYPFLSKFESSNIVTVTLSSNSQSSSKDIVPLEDSDILFFIPKESYSGASSKIAIFKKTAQGYKNYLINITTLHSSFQKTELQVGQNLPEFLSRPEFTSVKKALSSILKINTEYHAPASGLLVGAFCKPLKYESSDILDTKKVQVWDFVDYESPNNILPGYKYFTGHILNRGSFIDSPLAIDFTQESYQQLLAKINEITENNIDYASKDYKGKSTFIWDYVSDIIGDSPLDNYKIPAENWRSNNSLNCGLDVILTKFDIEQPNLNVEQLLDYMGITNIDSEKNTLDSAQKYSKYLKKNTGTLIGTYRSTLVTNYPDKWKSYENREINYSTYENYFSGMFSRNKGGIPPFYEDITPPGSTQKRYKLNFRTNDDRVALKVHQRIGKNHNINADENDKRHKCVDLINTLSSIDTDPLKFISLSYEITFQVICRVFLFSYDDEMKEDSFKTWFRNAFLRILSPYDIFKPKDSNPTTILLYPEYKKYFPEEMYLISKVDLHLKSKFQEDRSGGLCTFLSDNCLITFSVAEEYCYDPSLITDYEIIDDIEYTTEHHPEVFPQTGSLAVGSPKRVLSPSTYPFVRGNLGTKCYVYKLKNLELTTSPIPFVDANGEYHEDIDPDIRGNFNDWYIVPLKHVRKGSSLSEKNFFDVDTVTVDGVTKKTLSKSCIKTSLDNLLNSFIISDIPTLHDEDETSPYTKYSDIYITSLSGTFKGISLSLFDDLFSKNDSAAGDLFNRINTKILTTIIKNTPITTLSSNPVTIQDIPLIVDGLIELSEIINPSSRYIANLYPRLFQETTQKQYKTKYSIYCAYTDIENLGNFLEAKGYTSEDSIEKDVFTILRTYKDDLIKIVDKQSSDIRVTKLPSLTSLKKRLEFLKGKSLTIDDCKALDNMFGEGAPAIIKFNPGYETGEPNITEDFHLDILQSFCETVRLVDDYVKTKTEKAEEASYDTYTKALHSAYFLDRPSEEIILTEGIHDEDFSKFIEGLGDYHRDSKIFENVEDDINHRAAQIFSDDLGDTLQSSSASTVIKAFIEDYVTGTGSKKGLYPTASDWEEYTDIYNSLNNLATTIDDLAEKIVNTAKIYYDNLPKNFITCKIELASESTSTKASLKWNISDIINNNSLSKAFQPKYSYYISVDLNFSGASLKSDYLNAYSDRAASSNLPYARGVSSGYFTTFNKDQSFADYHGIHEFNKINSKGLLDENITSPKSPILLLFSFVEYAKWLAKKEIIRFINNCIQSEILGSCKLQADNLSQQATILLDLMLNLGMFCGFSRYDNLTTISIPSSLDPEGPFKDIEVGINWFQKINELDSDTSKDPSHHYNIYYEDYLKHKNGNVYLSKKPSTYKRLEIEDIGNVIANSHSDNIESGNYFTVNWTPNKTYDSDMAPMGECTLNIPEITYYYENIYETDSNGNTVTIGKDIDYSRIMILDSEDEESGLGPYVFSRDFYQENYDLNEKDLQDFSKQIKESLDGLEVSRNRSGDDSNLTNSTVSVEYDPVAKQLKGDSTSLYYTRYAALNNRLNRINGSARTLLALSSSLKNMVTEDFESNLITLDDIKVLPLEDYDAVTYLPAQNPHIDESGHQRISIPGKFYHTAELDLMRKSIGDHCALTCTKCSVKKHCPFYVEEDVIRTYCTPVEYIDLYIKDNELDLLQSFDISNNGDHITQNSSLYKDIHKVYSNVLSSEYFTAPEYEDAKTILETVKYQNERSLDQLKADLLKEYPDDFKPSQNPIGWLLGGRYGTVEINPIHDLVSPASNIDTSDASKYNYLYNAVFVADEETYVNYTESTNRYPVSVDISTSNSSTKTYSGYAKLKIPSSITLLDGLSDDDQIYLISDDLKDPEGNPIVPVIYLNTVDKFKHLLVFDVVDSLVSSSLNPSISIDESRLATNVAQWSINYLKGNCMYDPGGSDSNSHKNKDQFWMETVWSQKIDPVTKKVVWKSFNGRTRRVTGYQEPVMNQNSANETLVLSGKPVIATYINFVRKISIKMYQPSLEDPSKGTWLIEWASPYAISKCKPEEVELLKEDRRKTLQYMKTNLRLVAVKKKEEETY